MCGIVGYIGKKKCLPILIDGLKKLEYRGYDSAGVAYVLNDNIKLVKSVGRIKNLEDKIDNTINTYIGIGHTRWATHGEVNEVNSHPHHSGDIVIVHNGIIENYLEIKDFLTTKGYTFYGNTDTEIACAYIDYEYKNNKEKDIIQILNNCSKKFIGSYAIVVMIKSITNKLFVMKKDSPLIIANGNDETYIASDVSAFADSTNSYIILEDFEVGIVEENDIHIYRDMEEKNLNFINIDKDVMDNDLGNYSHYMLKEIHEQTSLIENLNNKYLKNLDDLVDISKYDKIHIIGCGTAYNAGLVGKCLIERYADIEIHVFIASEYRYQKLFINDKTLVIAVSQSGETADTLACIKKVKEFGCKTLGIVNVKNSSIARSVDNVIYTEAGIEVAVASTKAYVSQVYIFSLLAFKLGIMNNTLDRDVVVSEYNQLSNYIKNIINIDYSKLSKFLSKHDHIFYLGRGIDYFSMLEGALKIKEISYIHSEAIAAGELKHGSISLIDKDTPIVGLITDSNICSKTISNIKEVKSRGAYVILLVTNSIKKVIDSECYDDIIVIDDICDILSPMLSVIPLQLIAYYTALEKKCDIDKPRNLAKSVTVE